MAAILVAAMALSWEALRAALWAVERGHLRRAQRGGDVGGGQRGDFGIAEGADLIADQRSHLRAREGGDGGRLQGGQIGRLDDCNICGTDGGGLGRGEGRKLRCCQSDYLRGRQAILYLIACQRRNLRWLQSHDLIGAQRQNIIRGERREQGST